MIKLLEEIDELLTFLENTAHGEEGKRITEMRYKILTELSNSHKQVVSGKRPDSETIHAAAFKYATKMSTAPDKETPDWIIQDFKAGAQWALSQVACASGAVDTVAERWQYEAYKNEDYLMIYKDGKLFDKIPRARKSSEGQP